MALLPADRVNLTLSTSLDCINISTILFAAVEALSGQRYREVWELIGVVGFLRNNRAMASCADTMT